MLGGLPWHCSPEAPEAGVVTGRKEPAGRQCLLSSWKEDAGRREMHLVLRSVCAKQLLKQRGAVCLLSWRVFLSEPCWLLDLNYLFVEWLKCMKEIRWVCVILFPSIILWRMLSVWIDGHYSILHEGWSETLLSFVNCWFKDVLVLVGVLSLGQKASSGGPEGECWPRITSMINFYRLLNKDNLLCLKNKGNQHPPNEQSQGVRLWLYCQMLVLNYLLLQLPRVNVQRWGNFRVGVNCMVCKCLGGMKVSGWGGTYIFLWLVTSFLYFSQEVFVILED